MTKPKAFVENYLENVRKLFHYYKSLGEKAMAQLSNEQLHQRPDEHSNNIAVLVKHLSGNMLSRWSDFLESDGEKSFRNREQEFVDTLMTHEALMAYWEKGWSCLFKAIDPLQVEDMSRIAYIRNEGHSVVEAINRQLGHYSFHVGQIIVIAKAIKGADWQSLSIPRGGSAAFNQQKFEQPKSRKNFI
ncbi:MAG: DUF1572 family protein [Bacteroidota bacterium]